MEMTVRVSGGSLSVVENRFMIFKTKLYSYPIIGLLGDVFGVSYRTGPKGWIERRLMV